MRVDLFDLTLAMVVLCLTILVVSVSSDEQPVTHCATQQAQGQGGEG